MSISQTSQCIFVSGAKIWTSEIDGLVQERSNSIANAHVSLLHWLIDLWLLRICTLIYHAIIEYKITGVLHHGMCFMSARVTLYIREQLPSRLSKSRASDRVIVLEWPLRLIKLNTLPFYLVDPRELRHSFITQERIKKQESHTV